jgi:Tol biopolymer transport system component
MMPITDGTGDSWPVWFPDGRRVTFVSASGESEIISTVDARGGEVQRLHNSPYAEYPTGWSPDGRALIFTAETPGNGLDVSMLLIDGERKVTPLLNGPANESDARMSPDGRWIAYVSDESGREEIYLRPFPLAGARWQVSTAGGRQPRWRADGRELYFLESGRLTSVSLARGSTLDTGPPRTLFANIDTDDYDVSPDGQRFLVSLPARPRSGDSLHVVLNWASELERR